MISGADAYEVAAHCLAPIQGGEIHHHQWAADRIASAIVAAGTHEAKPHIRDSIVIFAEAMDKKLRRDDNLKPAWETDCLEALRDGLVAEFVELDHAMRDYKTKAECADGRALMLECCDVALFAMMIFSQLHPLTMHNRRGSPVHKIPRVAG